MSERIRKHRSTRQQINASEGYELIYWTRQLRCTEQDLLTAIATVGPEVDDVRRCLARRRLSRLHEESYGLT